jgi:HAD superfamily hydrolase (TIGR01509 family)
MSSTCILFDLDGVLVEFKELHKRAFIQAWNECMPEHAIDDQYHTLHLEAQSTRQKLDVISCNLGIEFDGQKISNKKQEITSVLLESAPVYQRTRNALEWAKSRGIRMGCCSNSIALTVRKSLEKLVPLSYFEIILSNEDVINPKPNPAIYQRAIELLAVSHEQIIVFEDSVVGKESARLANLRVIDIVDAMDISPRFLEICYNTCRRPFLSTLRLNVVIPMAGLGSRFQKAGYTISKPFLPVFGKPMFEWVISNIIPESIRPYANIHLIIRKEQLSEFKAHNMNNYQLHTVDTLTEGAACTVLTVKEYINTDEPLVIANSDQYVEWNADNFYRCLTHPEYDGVISTFYQPDTTDLRWSYVTVDSEGLVQNVAEKQFIGPLATTGIYGWKRGSDFVSHAEEMIHKNIRVNNEFYVCPVYNITVEHGRNIRTYNSERMWGLGVPDDYEYFLTNFKVI